MDIPLKDHLAHWIAEQVRIRRYASEVEAIEHALATRIQQDQADFDAEGDVLHRRMSESVGQYDRGKVLAADEQFFERLHDRVRNVASRTS